jgi:cell filamentation protein
MDWYSDSNGVPFNLRGITKKDELKRAEYNATSLRAIELRKAPIHGNYDLDHLQKIHYHLFQDIYEWAGKIRTKNFYKKDSYGWCSDFADSSAIADIANEISMFIRERNNLKGLDKEAFVDVFTQISVRLNEMHPFPEGNGRSARILLRQLAHEAGYDLKTEKCTGKEWNVASARSMTQTRNDVDAYNNPRPEVRDGDSTLIRELLARSIFPIQEKLPKISAVIENEAGEQKSTEEDGDDACRPF